MPLHTGILVSIKFPRLTLTAEVEEVGIAITYAVNLEDTGMGLGRDVLPVIDVGEALLRQLRAKGCPLPGIKGGLQNRELIIGINRNKLQSGGNVLLLKE